MSGGYYHTEESVKQYIELARDVSGARIIEKLKAYLPEGSKVLELGSGPGTDYDLLNNHYKTVGSDNSKVFLNHLKTKYPNGDFLELDAVTIKTGNTFDGIYSNKVMHHLEDNAFIESIKRQYEVLNPDGIMCHTFWKGTGSEIFKGLFVNYHTSESLKKPLEPILKYYTWISIKNLMKTIHSF